MNALSTSPDFFIKDDVNESLHKEFHLRYPHVPDDYLTFLDTFSLLTNLSDTTWFNSISDFNGTNDESAFSWNEFEIQSLEASDGDAESQKKIQTFWDQHLPIILSVKNGYAYFAINVSEENFGKIYYGEEPEFEEAEWVFRDFTSFIEAIKDQSLKKEYLEVFSI
ncbi:hypothetical protein [Chryseobacterium sp.]|uniref:hypothetical protein n=1 Tax=Chryseobacterium sp. TaxID=1871047 RepID=UPI00289D5634|nr:hypothetical protein [Chryseobacterium sp.]